MHVYMSLPIYLSIYLHHHTLSFDLVSWTATAFYNHVTFCHTVMRRVSPDLRECSEGLLITPLSTLCAQSCLLPSGTAAAHTW